MTRFVFFLVAAVVAGQVCADAFAQCPRAKLIANDGQPDDRFGEAVALDGDWAVTGALGDDDFGEWSGSAYAFSRGSDGGWVEYQKLTADDGAPDDFFSREAVAILGDLIAIGAVSDNDRGNWSGSAYVFERDGEGTWAQTAKLLAGDGSEDDFFGSSIGISGEQVLVGARGNGLAGAVYVFEPAEGEWSQVDKLTPRRASLGAEFGKTLAVSGGLLVSGAQFQVESESVGAAFVFVRDRDGVWTQEAKLLADDGSTSDFFGIAVAVDGETIVVGASGHEHHAEDDGAAYVFERDGERQWTQTAELLAEDWGTDDGFGIRVAVSGGVIAVGAWQGDGPERDDVGAVYFFEKVGTDETWVQTGKINAPDGALQDQFGAALAMDDGTLLVGAWLDDDNGENSGSAYIIEMERCGDINGDGAVDLADHERFFECLTGPGGQVRAVCEPADLDRDQDADLHDFTLLTQSLP